ncbi:cellular tumor antigen p53-like [Dendronephthya gigantea]|uniref:cellular tumor antigen p53-like n=1 Tax=Dendronephthya gigantea TaxID=151771 RepID=UPI00106BEC6B|nr:cellular tumor antigen p53-like [Dendronephthya gigantea]
MSGEGSSRSSRDEVKHFPGPHQFSVHPTGFELQENQSDFIKKSVEYTFSSKLNRLYVKKMAICPFGIFTSATTPVGSQVKILVYAHNSEPVMRCRAHTEGDERQEDFVSLLHFMRSKNVSAIYEGDSQTGELSIILPQIKPEGDIENLTFLCSSKHCLKKELFIKFSLIYKDEVIGFHEFGLHVCSSPGRDRINHESKKKIECRRKRKLPTDPGPHYSTKKTAIPSSQPEVFNIVVKNRSVYDLLMKVNRGLELIEAVPQDVQDYYLKRFWAKNVASTSEAEANTVTASAPHDRRKLETRATLRRIIVRS